MFSFLTDVSQSPSVIRAMLVVQHEVQRATAGVAKVAERWRAFGALWKADREGALAKLRQAPAVLALLCCLSLLRFWRHLSPQVEAKQHDSCHPQCPAAQPHLPTLCHPPHTCVCRGRKGIGPLALEERMAQYHRLGEEAWVAGGDQDVHFIRVRYSAWGPDGGCSFVLHFEQNHVAPPHKWCMALHSTAHCVNAPCV